MFEKVAEFYAREKYSPGTDSFIVAAAEDAFEDGANFGYKWANEWHYPSKGEYPKECEDVLCYCKCRTEIKFCCVGHIVAGGDNKIRWWSSDRSEKLKVYAWKEITPPKEVKENEN